MSSILDALNKLEQEKAQAKREAERSDIDPVSAAQDLVGKSMLRDRVTLRVSPSTLAISGVLIVIALVAASVAVSLVVLNSMSGTGSEASVAASTRDVPVSVTVAEETPAEMPAAIASPPSAAAEDSAVGAPETKETTLSASDPQATVVDEAKLSGLSEPAEGPVADDKETAKLEVDAASAKGESAGAPEANVASEPAPPVPAAEPKVTTPSAEEPTTADTSASTTVAAVTEDDEPARDLSAGRERIARQFEDQDLFRSRTSVPGPADNPPAPTVAESLTSLPVMTPVDMARYGFERMTVNMVRPVSETNPQGSAIITLRETGSDGVALENRLRFYEGQRLQGSSLRLFKVERGGIGLEDARSGDRYYLRF